jgi:protein required for attachment to host cells
MSIWVVVADNSRARIFSAEKAASSLSEVRDLTNPEARLHEGDLVSDKGGRDRGMAGAHGFGIEDEHKHEGYEKFALAVCTELESARVSGQLSKLYVVAAPSFLGLLRKHQSSALRQLVQGEVDKNLTTQDAKAIRGCLPDFL